MADLDLATIVQPVLATVGVVITALLSVYIPKGFSLLQVKTGLTFTDQQRTAFLGAVQTGAGILETELDKGALKIAHINISNPAVLAQAQAVINATPQAAAAFGMTVEGTARMLIGKVDTAKHGDDAAPVMAPLSVPVPSIPAMPMPSVLGIQASPAAPIVTA